MSRRKKRRNNDESDDSNWLTTYGDMMTLLLAFFVLLYSFSSVDVQKFRNVVEALQGNLGVLKGGKTISSSDLITAGVRDENLGMPELNRINQKITSYLQEQELEDEIKVEMTERGLTIRFTGKVLFDIGRATIKEDAYSILDKISGIISEVPNQIMVEGHTDNLPISNSRFPSNWELSTARATEVVKYFIEENSITPAKLSAAGYSKYKPVKPNDSPENRALNRRVDVILLKREFSEASRQKGGKLDE
ncbi:flagellar motor protein MotB [Acetohalobium arabaticum]|uniref:OmpA/MotB domain protein n=1 Tax=Acetohalobium arabaticum (strain ATCC 49924 / DSM 5501 / Z-7288) TaxID=574087 RepID=D9QRJ8_ACEAZ|nr:flagellar motor protein MotB [Acetohalobium arabaticum]ADL13139.1 OmpA/MotB domain protein [Acetohalobium arabaticum DSM 5501]